MKKKMYYMSMVMWVLSILMSCKDDEVKPPTLNWLTKIERDGEVVLELQYDTEKKLVRTNMFSDDVLYAYTLHEYNNKGIQESRRYEATGDDLEYRAVYTLNNVGVITKAEYYTTASDFKAVSGTYIFSYDAPGNLKSLEYNPPGKPVSSIKEYTYDTEGNRIRVKRTEAPSQPKERISYVIDYTPGQKSIPDHWHEYLTILTVLELDEFLLYMYSASTRQLYYTDEGEVLNEYLIEPREQQFDDNGYLSQQTLTGVSLSSVSPKSVSTLKYEYMP